MNGWEYAMYGSLRFFLASVCRILIFRNLDAETEGKKGRKALGLLCLFIPAAGYALPVFLNRLLSAGVQTLLLLAGLFGYLYFDKACSRRKAAYLSILGVVILADFQILFWLPPWRMLHQMALPPAEGAVRNMFWLLIAEYSLRLLMVLAVSKHIQIREIHQMGWLNFATCLFMLAAESYVRRSLYGQDKGTAVSFAYIIFFLILLYVINIERYLATEERIRQNNMALISQKYQIKNMELYIEADNSMRRLNHDIKNHLRSIRQLANMQEVEEYVDGLLGEMPDSRLLVNTGSGFLDRLFSVKMQEASHAGVTLRAYVEGGELERIPQRDLSTIFGNAIDNAIEAAGKLDDIERREVVIRTEKFANKLVISIANYARGSMVFRDGIPVTSKKDKSIHGLGYVNIQRAVKKNGGTVSVSYNEKTGLFKLNILI